MQPDPSPWPSGAFGWEIWHDNQFSSALAKKMQEEWGTNLKSAFILKNKIWMTKKYI